MKNLFREYGLTFSALMVRETFAYMWKEHPLAETPGDTVSLKALGREPLIVPERPSRVRAIEQWFASCGMEPVIVCRTSNYINGLALVEQNAGICIFPQATYTPNPYVVTKLITDPPKIAEYFLVYPKEDLLSELTEAFRDYVSDFVAEDRHLTDRFRTKAEEFAIPDGAALL